MKAVFTLTENEIRIALHEYLGARAFRGDRLNRGPVLVWPKKARRMSVRCCYDNKEK
jgi:hypothetical protein